MSEKRTRLSNGDKIAILEAIRIPGKLFGIISEQEAKESFASLDLSRMKKFMQKNM